MLETRARDRRRACPHDLPMPPPRRVEPHRKDDPSVTFPEIDAATQSPASQTRLKRQLVELAIAQATAAEWAESVETNKRLLELGPDSEAENRLAKALWEMGELGSARDHY